MMWALGGLLAGLFAGLLLALASNEKALREKTARLREESRMLVRATDDLCVMQRRESDARARLDEELRGRRAFLRRARQRYGNLTQVVLLMDANAGYNLRRSKQWQTVVEAARQAQRDGSPAGDVTDPCDVGNHEALEWGGVTRCRHCLVRLDGGEA